MKTKILGFLLGLFGQALICIIFFLLLPPSIFSEESVMWLDFVVTSIVFWVWAGNVLFHSLSIDDATQKGIGGLGVKLYGAWMYTLFALGYMLLGFYYSYSGDPISFGWQITFQAIFLFGLLAMMLGSFKATEKTAEIYRKEETIKKGKLGVRESLTNLLYSMEDGAADAEQVARVRRLVEETRYITPSTSDEARILDNRINDDCYSISIALPDYKINEQNIVGLIHKLELDVERRKAAK